VLTDEQRTEIQRLVESRFGELLQLQSEKEKTTAKILKGRVEGRKLLAVENISIETSDAPSSLEPLVRVIARAVEVLGTSEKALRWLNAPIRSLGDQTPASLLNTPEGIKRVEDALGRIEHGVW
jgi:putative toxin-antitoxin system antitoxin component (TIGR02293 family)